MSLPRGTEGSNPAPSTGESRANLTSSSYNTSFRASRRVAARRSYSFGFASPSGSRGLTAAGLRTLGPGHAEFCCHADARLPATGSGAEAGRFSSIFLRGEPFHVPDGPFGLGGLQIIALLGRFCELAVVFEDALADERLFVAARTAALTASAFLSSRLAFRREL